MADYDVMISDGPSSCGCGSRMYRGDVVAFIGGRAHCLSCAEKNGAPPVPVAIVAAASRMMREHFYCALANALTAPRKDFVGPRDFNGILAEHDTGAAQRS